MQGGSAMTEQLVQCEFFVPIVPESPIDSDGFHS
jgi:hypothetical protein